MAQLRDLVEAVKADDAGRVVELLDARPALVRVTTEHEKTALHWAAEVDAVEAARVLLDSGAEIEARTSWGASPLDWAATMGSARVADLLLERGAMGLTLITAAALGMLPRVEEIASSARDLDEHRRRDAPDEPDVHWPADTAHILGDVLSDALYAAARNGHAEVVELLLAHGAGVDARGFFGGTALHWAAINGHADTVALLLSRGAARGARDAKFDATPAGWAREGGHTELAALLEPTS